MPKFMKNIIKTMGYTSPVVEFLEVESEGVLCESTASGSHISCDEEEGITF